MKRGKPLRRTGFKRYPAGDKPSGEPKRKPMRKRTPRNGRLPEDVRTTVMLRAGGRCEAGLAGVCTGEAQEFHHRQSRSASRDPHTIVNGAGLCTACHYYITHVSPEEGRERGLVVSRHYEGDPGDKPMLVRSYGLKDYMWVYLTPEGGYRPCKALD